MNIAEQVIDAFGGQTKAGIALGVPVTTVDSWKRSGKIPSWRHASILAAAKKHKVNLPEAFLERVAA